MKSPSPLIILSWGEVFRVPRSGWNKMVKDAIAKNGDVNVRDCGKSLGVVDHDLTEWNLDDWEDV